jgi:RNA polymerase sigma factor (sigma-70 family)
MDDQTLLDAYANGGSHDAFAQLMHRHAGMVYASARRQVRDVHLAEDVTQTVFVTLSKKARRLPSHATLAGWLLKTTHFAACNALRHERRLKRREHRLADMTNDVASSDPASPQDEMWDEVSPLVDQAMAHLRGGDREAIALRYFESKSLAQVAAALQINEEAARKRVARALDRLRAYLLKRGVAVQPAVLGSLIGAHAIEAPPATVITAVACALPARGTAIVMSKGAAVAMGAKVKLAIIAILVAALLVGGGVWLVRSWGPRLIVIEPRMPTPSRITGPDGRELRSVAAPPGPDWRSSQQGQMLTAGAVDRRGQLWIASEEDGVSRFDAANQAWHHCTTAEGLGEESAYAIAIDLQGRVWVGHLRSGLSVYNGVQWKNYGPLNGPLGQRVFAIAVCPPTAPRGGGDVWIATDRGLTRYSAASDSWSYYTLADGLPSDQASSLAFDRDGNLYLGTQCDGIAIASASADYKTWRHVSGMEHQPLTPTGQGLPSNTINDLLVAQDGTIFAATSRGIAKSSDHGINWTFYRGADWAGKIRESISGPPAGWQPQGTALIAEDYVACLAQDEHGLIWLGFRTKGYECLHPGTMKIVMVGGDRKTDDCGVIVPRHNLPPVIGTRGYGLRQPDEYFVAADASAETEAPRSSPAASALPSPAPAPSAQELQSLTARISALPDTPLQGAYLADDWATQGDWVGRYGRQQAIWPRYNELACSPAYKLNVWGGKHRKQKLIHGYYTYFRKMDSKSPKVLYQPLLGTRAQGEWNDGGWQGNVYDTDWEGPDVWVEVAVPQGMHRVSLYIFNVDGDAGTNRRRDYAIELKTYVPRIEDAQEAPILARSRFVPSINPVYKTFLVAGGRYWIRIASNYSFAAKVMSVMVDPADGSAPAADDATAHYLSGVPYDPPKAEPPTAGDSPQLQAAYKLWTSLDRVYDRAAAAPLQLPYRMLAYRAASAGGAKSELLANWRWALHLWTGQDRSEWEATMAKSRVRLHEVEARQSAATAAQQALGRLLTRRPATRLTTRPATRLIPPWSATQPATRPLQPSPAALSAGPGS